MENPLGANASPSSRFLAAPARMALCFPEIMGRPPMRFGAFVFAAAWMLTASTLCASAQDRHGTVERIKVHGGHLEGNLLGDSPDRDVSVYLPPSYGAAKNRRYPVVYMLHGYNGDDKGWFLNPNHYIVVPKTADNA